MVYRAKSTRGRDRTCDLLFRKQAPYPLGHASLFLYSNLQRLYREEDTSHFQQVMIILTFPQVVMYVASEVPSAVKGVCLLNCAGGMNQRGLYKDSLQLAVMRPLFEFFEFLLKRKNIASFLFSKFRQASSTYLS